MTKEPSELRVVIGELMGEVLVREPLTAREDFFDCGGDSVRAVEVLQRLIGEREAEQAAALQAALLDAIFEDASPANLAAVCVEHGHPADAAPAPGAGH
jgi:aryl carrier-like protein